MGKKFLLPLLASLGLAAAVSVPAVVASVSQRDENAETVLNYNPKVRQDRFYTKLVSDTQDFADPYLAYYQVIDYSYNPNTHPVAYDNVVSFVDDDYAVGPSEGYHFWALIDEDNGEYFLKITFLASTDMDDTLAYVDGVKYFYESGDSHSFYLADGTTLDICTLVYASDAFSASPDAQLAALYSGSHQLQVLHLEASYADYTASHQVVSGIEAGLPFVSNAAQALVGGFDAMALDNGALTNVMAFSFTLLGLGCAVGICKKVFSWITGRHGM